MNAEIDNTNFAMVGAHGDKIVVLNYIAVRQMSKSQALVLAAWLVTLASDGQDFGAILDAVQNS